MKKNLGLILGVVSSIIVIGLLVLVMFLKPADEKEPEITLETAGFKEINIEGFKELLNKDEKNVVLIARPGCGYCVMFTPVLYKVKEELGFDVYYINTDSFTQEDFEKLDSTNKYFKENDWGTPLTLIVKNNTVIDAINGYVELEEAKDFFLNNEMGE